MLLPLPTVIGLVTFSPFNIMTVTSPRLMMMTRWPNPGFGTHYKSTSGITGIGMPSLTLTGYCYWLSDFFTFQQLAALKIKIKRMCRCGAWRLGGCKSSTVRASQFCGVDLALESKIFFYILACCVRPNKRQGVWEEIISQNSVRMTLKCGP